MGLETLVRNSRTTDSRSAPKSAEVSALVWQRGSRPVRSPICALLLLAGCGHAAPNRNWDDLRQRIEQTLHVTRPRPNLKDKMYGRFSPAAGVTADRISYATDDGLRVPAIVYHESGPTISQHPALVVVDGHGADKSSWYSYWAGISYARAGAVVLTYDPIGEYERNQERLSKTGQHDQYIAPDDMARRLSGLMITDVMQAVGYLAGRQDVDKKRIAVLGFSMGSFVSSLACALDTRIHACVLAGGGDLDGTNGYWDNSNKMCQAIPYRSLAFLGERGPVIYALNAKRGPTLVINGDRDDVVDIVHHEKDWFEELRKQTVEELGSSKNVFDIAFQAGGGHSPYFLTKTSALWLEDKLKFPNWDRKKIAAMPETRIEDWAVKNGLANAAGSFFKRNDGAMMALGENVPAVPRDQLHAIPEVVWDAEMRDYIYETWVERAQAAIQSGAP
jgi:dienelactone hydrolase